MEEPRLRAGRDQAGNGLDWGRSSANDRWDPVNDRNGKGGIAVAKQ